MFAFDYIADFKDKRTGEHFTFHNEPAAIDAFLHTENAIFATFNGKHYDRFVLSAMCRDGTTEVVKAVNDWIIGGFNPWEYPDRDVIGMSFPLYDLKDDCEQGLSLKAIEGHMGMDIRETTVPFDLDRPLTDAELDEVVFYCKHDVDATDMLDDLRQNYLKNKIKLGEEVGLAPEKALYMTNAKLTAAYLQAVPKEHCDEREYQYPANLLKRYIPQEVFQFFDRLHDLSIPDEVVFAEKMKITVGNCPCTIAYGGIHGAIPCYTENATEHRSIRNKDVASYYPHQMTINGYCSRNIPSPELYAATIERRVKAKHNGDKATANALKLVLNTTYGAMLNEYNPLYDPLMGRSVCISGQLQLLELAEHLVADCPTLEIIQLNTDGIMVSLDDCDVPLYQVITDEWQQRTGFELEEDRIKRICQKDVNNYVEIPAEGKPKIKGGALVRGVSEAGAFKVNNNAPIIADAVREFLANGTPAQDTIYSSNKPLDFQFISKVGHLYSNSYQQINGKMVEVQKVNRVYAGFDYAFGTLYKRHAETGAVAKVGGLPLCCIIDNNNEITMDQINRDWYVKQAEKTIDDFLGKEVPKRSNRKANKLKRELLRQLEE